MKTTRTGNKIPSDLPIRDPNSEGYISLDLPRLFAILRRNVEWLRGVGDGLDNVRVLQEAVSLARTLNEYERDHPEQFSGVTKDVDVR